MVSFLASATLAISLLAATPQPPQWESDYGKALQATRADNRPLLVVLDKPAIAGASLEPALFSENAIEGQEFDLLRSYRLCHVDVTTDYGQQVAKAFGAESFPFTAIIDKTGSVVIHSKVGQIAPQEWQQTLKTHKEGNRTDVIAVSQNAQTWTVNYAGPQSMQFESSTIQNLNRSNCPSCQKRSF